MHYYRYLYEEVNFSGGAAFSIIAILSDIENTGRYSVYSKASSFSQQAIASTTLDGIPSLINVSLRYSIERNVMQPIRRHSSRLVPPLPSSPQELYLGRASIRTFIFYNRRMSIYNMKQKNPIIVTKWLYFTIHHYILQYL